MNSLSFDLPNFTYSVDTNVNNPFCLFVECYLISPKFTITANFLDQLH